jgi:hypothetical protein
MDRIYRLIWGKSHEISDVLQSYTLCWALIVGLGLILLPPAAAQTTTPCETQFQCIPGGVYTVTFLVSGDTSACVFDSVVSWGDSTSDNVNNVTDGETISHQYLQPAVYTIQVTGSGSPLVSGATCTFNPTTIIIEIPSVKLAAQNLLDLLFNHYDPNRIALVAGQLSNQQIAQAAKEARQQCSFVRGGYNPFAPGLPPVSEGRVDIPTDAQLQQCQTLIRNVSTTAPGFIDAVGCANGFSSIGSCIVSVILRRLRIFGQRDKLEAERSKGA